MAQMMEYLANYHKCLFIDDFYFPPRFSFCLAFKMAFSMLNFWNLKWKKREFCFKFVLFCFDQYPYSIQMLMFLSFLLVFVMRWDLSRLLLFKHGQLEHNNNNSFMTITGTFRYWTKVSKMNWKELIGLFTDDVINGKNDTEVKEVYCFQFITEMSSVFD